MSTTAPFFARDFPYVLHEQVARVRPSLCGQGSTLAMSGPAEDPSLLDSLARRFAVTKTSWVAFVTSYTDMFRVWFRIRGYIRYYNTEVSYSNLRNIKLFEK